MFNDKERAKRRREWLAFAFTATVMFPGWAAADQLVTSIADYKDDVEEEKPAPGDVSRGSSDLDIGEEVVALRFALDVPQYAVIESAAVQFEAKSSDSVTTSLTISIEDAGDAAGFGKSDGDISPRLAGAVGSVNWNPDPWHKGDAGMAQRTTDISALLQQIVDRDDWIAGNHVALFIDGSGERDAVTYDSDPASAAQLEVVFVTGEAPDLPAPDPTPTPDPDPVPDTVPDLEDDTPFIDATWPTLSTGIAAGFTPRRCCSSHGTSKDFHRALDIRDWWIDYRTAPNAGDPVYAVADGRMIRRHHRSDPENFSSKGGAIVIAHVPDRPIIAPTGLMATEFASYYLHLGSVELSIQPGDMVYKGQLIGTVGDINADSNDPDSAWVPTRTSHLHFEIRAGHSYQNSSGEWKFDDDWDHLASGEEFDGHINPYLILPAPEYNNANEAFVWNESNAPVGIDCTSDPDKVSLCYAFPEDESDINEIIFTNVSGETKVVNFNTREGINPHDIDDFAGYNDVWIADLDWIDTADLTASNGKRIWAMKVQVPSSWQPVSAQVSDIWGNRIIMSL